VLANILEAHRHRNLIDSRKHHPMCIFVINNMKLGAIILRTRHNALSVMPKTIDMQIAKVLPNRSNGLRLPFLVLYLQSGVFEA